MAAPTTAGSVSYTHLDVYKRQVCTTRLMLVDQSRALAVVTRPRHQVPQARAAGRLWLVVKGFKPSPITAGMANPTDRA